MDQQENDTSEEQIKQYPLTEDECYSPEAFEAAKPKFNSNIKGKLILQDPTNSGVGESLLKLLNEKPNIRSKKDVREWRDKVTELSDKYNELVGFKAFGDEFPEPYNKE